MNSPLPSFSLTALLDVSPYLVKGVDAGNGVTLQPGSQYIYILLGSGPLMIIGAFMLIRIMYARVRFFALEYGNGSFFGRVGAIAPSIFAGGLLLLLGLAATWLGWQGMGYSVTLTREGLHEVARGGSFHYAWSDATSAAERIKSTEFWVVFDKDGRKCRVEFQQRYIGEKLQDKAIAIADEALAFSKAERIKPDGGTSTLKP
ncbi:hypothetical protein [Prosthecobacter sp.]|uniref:hypothetical protein n=1 Tax=Prosthecobacter sp. TaxID=1965333 RepID=UPI0037836408